MLGILLIFLLLVFLIFFYPYFLAHRKTVAPKSPRFDAQMKKLWTIAQESMKDRKPLRAEKALLTILKFDEKNAAAYNRLGILYAKEQKFDDAIDCFEIAQSLDSNPSSLHNAGLIYLETGAYEKAAMAFKQALELEGGLPARYLALAKALEKLGRTNEAVDALESAYELDASTTTLRQILALYEATNNQEGIEATTARINEQLAALEKKKQLTAPKKRVTRRHFYPTFRRSSRAPQAKKTSTQKSLTPSRLTRPKNKKIQL